jgi:ribosomal protein S18 acetylase RimI-like enzyme
MSHLTAAEVRSLPRVRPAAPADAAGVRACVVSAFEHYVERIGKPPAPMLLDFDAEIRANRVWVVSGDSGIIGALVQYETDLGFYIDTVAVSPSSQGKGVGRALLELAEREALGRGYRSIYLCTNSKMTENQALYPRLGYVEYERKNEAGYDRVFYRKELVAPSAGV